MKKFLTSVRQCLANLFKKSTTKIVSIYLITILLFSVVYYLFFLTNTASFYVSSQYNERVRSVWDAIEHEGIFEIKDLTEVPFALDEFNQRIRNINDSIIASYDYEAALKAEQESVKISIDQVYSRLEDSRYEQVEEFKSKHLQPYQDSLERFKNFIAQLGLDEKEMISKGYYLELAKLELVVAQKNSELCDYVLSNWSGFGDRAHYDSYDTLVTRDLDIQNKLSECQEKRRDWLARYNQLVKDFHWNRIEKVRFIDFVHFSLLVSTSNSFGDILPNTTYTRILVSIQLLIGIFLLAMFMEELFKSNK